MTGLRHISGAYNDASARRDSDFMSYLGKVFDAETATRVKTAFDCMGLAMPEGNDEFIEGAEGALIFLKDYGIVIRIEQTEFKETLHSWLKPDRINDS